MATDNPGTPRYLTRIYGGPQHFLLASYVVYASSPVQAYHKAVEQYARTLSAEVVGRMGPDADERMQDGVVR